MLLTSLHSDLVLQGGLNIVRAALLRAWSATSRAARVCSCVKALSAHIVDASVSHIRQLHTGLENVGQDRITMRAGHTGSAIRAHGRKPFVQREAVPVQ